jgi:hypothetical protein
MLTSWIHAGGDEAMPVEESGNMLIMALSYTQKTNDQSLIKTYVSGLALVEAP